MLIYAYIAFVRADNSLKSGAPGLASVFHTLAQTPRPERTSSTNATDVIRGHHLRSDRWHPAREKPTLSESAEQRAALITKAGRRAAIAELPEGTHHQA